MIRPAHQGVEVWLCVEPVDFRKSARNLSTTLRHRRLRFTEQSLLLWMWMWQVG